MPSSRAARIALLAVAVVIGLLIVCQFVLPPLAERSIRGKVDDDATVNDVKVSAFPAVKLLWKHADKVEVSLGEVRASTSRFADLVDEAKGVDEVDVTAQKAMIGDAQLSRAEFHKNGDDLVGTGFMSEDAILAALPLGFRVKPVRTDNGQLIVRGSPGSSAGPSGSRDASSRRTARSSSTRERAARRRARRLHGLHRHRVAVESVTASASGATSSSPRGKLG